MFIVSLFSVVWEIFHNHTLIPMVAHLLCLLLREWFEGCSDFFPDHKTVELCLQLASQQKQARELSMQAVNLKIDLSDKS